MNSKKWKSKKNTEKRRRDEDGEDAEAEEEEDDDDDGNPTENVGKEGDGVVLKTKRKKKQKKAKGPNNWIYVSGLPVDVTLEEIKDHFSKVHLHKHCITVSSLPMFYEKSCHAVVLSYQNTCNLIYSTYFLYPSTDGPYCDQCG